ncbi:glycosyltransferase family A protein [Psychrobacter sp. ENNN9_III]|uniref:glycosyltransferase family A protein n=1 Tax=Psychrobacter sp. ENNN9_III TaxID=1254334 RepID=UPI00071E7E06|nr:glycosyltransferase family A protein [Psychrobacter sp. ENNN9_III]
MSSNVFLLSKANELFRAKNYSEAKKLYIEAGELVGIESVKANIMLCDSRNGISNLNDSYKYLENTKHGIPISKETDIVQNNSVKYILKSLQEFDGFKDINKVINKKALPKVTYVVTSFNAEQTIERSIQSILMQSYPNIEIVICDDKSSDGTWEKLKILKEQSEKSIKIIRTNVNGGTYLAKNIAIESATGEFILFQDADDYSHPERTIVQIYPLIENKDLIATRTKYARFNPDTMDIIPVGGNLSKFGLITLAVRRDAFVDIGYFDSVRKAGDDEWFQRLRHLYGRDSIKELDVALYLAELRQNSLVADMITFNDDGSVEQSSSEDRKNYVKIFKNNYKDKNKKKQWYKNIYAPYRLRPIRSYPESISSLNPPNEKVFASGCCIPERLESFQLVVQRILPQVDHLYVYLDKFEKIPSFLNHDKITVTLSKDCFKDYRDNAKFLAFDKLKNQLSNFYYFTIDDDILYPHDYVRSLLDRLKVYKNSLVIGVHGVMYEENPRSYFKRRFVYHFQGTKLESPKLVNNLGTGTVAFHSSLFRQLNPDMWPTGGMVDIYFSNECRKNNILLLCIDRHKNWLNETYESKGSPNLCDEYRVSDKEAKIISEIKTMSPWGYKSIKAVMQDNKYIGMGLESMLPEFVDDVKVANFFQRYR